MNKTGVAAISAVIAVLLSVAGCGSEGSQGVDGTAQDHLFAPQSAEAIAETDATEDVKITSTKTVEDPYTGLELRTKYLVTNPTQGRVSYTITFEYLDRSGNRIGEDYGYVESLSGHQASHESMTLWGDDLKGVVSVHLVDVMRVPVV